MKKIFLIIHTDNIGGAEKRFSGLWECLVTQNIEIYLVCRTILLEKLSSTLSFSTVKSLHRDKIIEYEFPETAISFTKKCVEFVEEYTHSEDLLHFMVDYPFAFLKRETIFSITQSSLDNLNWKGKFMYYISPLLATKIDVLDPTIYNNFSKIFFWKKKNITLTRSSFCNSDLYYPLPEKKDWIVFLGRFNSGKQVVKYVKSIPQIYASIKDKAKNDLHFYILGHGEDYAIINKIMQEKAFQGIPLTLGFEANPEIILNKSKIFVSLQKFNNYPSRSLIEALCAGNIPIVTENGQSKWIADEQFSYYVSESFSEEELIEAFVKIYSIDSREMQKKGIEARAFILDNHTIKKMSEYYLELYFKHSIRAKTVL